MNLRQKIIDVFPTTAIGMEYFDSEDVTESIMRIFNQWLEEQGAESLVTTVKNPAIHYEPLRIEETK